MPRPTTKVVNAKPCQTCSHTSRYASSGHCVECLKRRNKQNRDYKTRYMREYRTRPEIREYITKYNRQYKLLKTYNLTLEDYQRYFTAQDGRCAICSQPAHQLCVDHNHDTGEVRGLLCNDCNRVLGIFKDEPQRFEQAAEYLKRFGD